MSRLRPLSLLAVLTAVVAVAGCGGSNVSADEVPGAPVALKVPEVKAGGSSTLGAGGTASGNQSTDSNASTDDSSDTSAQATATPSGTTGSGTTGGTQTQQQQTQQNGGTGQSQNSGKPFDDFCKNNPGAC